jgi:hypothetical protein
MLSFVLLKDPCKLQKPETMEDIYLRNNHKHVE